MRILILASLLWMVGCKSQPTAFIASGSGYDIAVRPDGPCTVTITNVTDKPILVDTYFDRFDVQTRGPNGRLLSHSDTEKSRLPGVDEWQQLEPRQSVTLTITMSGSVEGISALRALRRSDQVIVGVHDRVPEGKWKKLNLRTDASLFPGLIILKSSP